MGGTHGFDRLTKSPDVNNVRKRSMRDLFSCEPKPTDFGRVSWEVTAKKGDKRKVIDIKADFEGEGMILPIGGSSTTVLEMTEPRSGWVSIKARKLMIQN